MFFCSFLAPLSAGDSVQTLRATVYPRANQRQERGTRHPPRDQQRCRGRRGSRRTPRRRLGIEEDRLRGRGRGSGLEAGKGPGPRHGDPGRGRAAGAAGVGHGPALRCSPRTPLTIGIGAKQSGFRRGRSRSLRTITSSPVRVGARSRIHGEGTLSADLRRLHDHAKARACRRGATLPPSWDWGLMGKAGHRCVPWKRWQTGGMRSRYWRSTKRAKGSSDDGHVREYEHGGVTT
jgi:hypothetical protein